MTWRRALNLFAGALVWLLIALTGTLTLAGFAEPCHWWLGQLVHFRVQYAVILLALTGLMLLARRWRGAMVPLALAAVNLAVIVPLFFGGNHQGNVEKKLRMLSINVDSENTNYDRVLALVKETDPDFVLLVDVDMPWIQAMTPLLENRRYGRAMPSPGSSGIAFYSRPLLKDVNILAPVPYDRPLVIAHLVIDEVPLSIIGVHAVSPRTASSSHDRNQQLAAIADLARQQDSPVIVAGDFNSTSWSRAFENMLSTGDLIDTRRGFGVQPTWPAACWALRIPIDHFLVSPSIAVHQRWVGPDIGSDHLPILMDFSLPLPPP